MLSTFWIIAGGIIGLEVILLIVIIIALGRSGQTVVVRQQQPVGGYGAQPGGYPAAPQGYPPQQQPGGYPAQGGGFPPQTGGYPPQSPAGFPSAGETPPSYPPQA